MTNTCRTSRLKQAAWIGMLGLTVIVLCAPGSARAEDDDDSIWTLNERVVKNLMGAVGLRNGTESGIDYRERSPLVVPPSRALPPPAAAGAPANPAWPVDPDQKRRREAARSKSSKKYLTGTNEDSRPLRRDELDPPGTEAARGQGSKTSTGSNEKSMLPSELGYLGGLFSLKSLGFGAQSDEVSTFQQEPARESLAEPPRGYQTPSASEPYGVVKRTERRVTPYDPAVGSTGKPQ